MITYGRKNLRTGVVVARVGRPDDFSWWWAWWAHADGSRGPFDTGNYRTERGAKTVATQNAQLKYTNRTDELGPWEVSP